MVKNHGRSQAWSSQVKPLFPYDPLCQFDPLGPSHEPKISAFPISAFCFCFRSQSRLVKPLSLSDPRYLCQIDPVEPSCFSPLPAPGSALTSRSSLVKPKFAQSGPHDPTF